MNSLEGLNRALEACQPQDPAAGSIAEEVCNHCGGSGILRLDEQRFRTCLDCLGQGRRVRCAAATTTADVLQLSRPGLSVSVSSSAA
jgi:DnaJ-class molecular chaperone